MGKMRLTDFCNQYKSTSTREPLDSRIRSERCSDHPRAGPKAKANESDEVRRQTAYMATQLRVKKRLTAPLQLRSLRAHLSTIMVETSAALRIRHAFGGADPLRRIQPRMGPHKRPLTLSVALRSRARRTSRVFAESQGRFHHSHVNKSSFPDPERLPSTSALLPPQKCEMLSHLPALCEEEPVTAPAALPP